jgi:hypothetical protein
VRREEGFWGRRVRVRGVGREEKEWRLDSWRERRGKEEGVAGVASPWACVTDASRGALMCARPGALPFADSRARHPFPLEFFPRA